MGKWLGYMVELYHDGQWYNIDQWHRHANGQLRHHFLYTAPERDILSSAHDELALSRERICFSDLAAETQDIICAENPAFERSTFDSWDFFIWGSFSDLETLLQKLAAKENDKCISKDLLETLILLVEKLDEILKRIDNEDIGFVITENGLPDMVLIPFRWFAENFPDEVPDGL